MNKVCLNCGKEIVPKYFIQKGKNVLESPSQVERRKYCDRLCMRKAFTKKVSDSQSYRCAHQTAKKIVMLNGGINYCIKCGATKSLDVHHKDGNWRNNNLENLVVLCRSCHMKDHNPKTECKVDGCNNKVKGYGYCYKHYQRFKKYGSPYIVKWNTRHTKNDADVTNK